MSRTDFAIFSAALALVLGLYAVLWQSGGVADRVSVWVAGQERLSLPLSEDRTVSVQGALGRSLIEIRERRVRVVESPGPRKICVRTGWLEHAGESAICLPNQVVVRIDSPQPRFDSMNF